MLMGVALVAIWTISMLLFVTDPRNPSSRGASAMALVGGFGFLAGSLNEEIRPLLIGSDAPFIQGWSLFSFLDRIVMVSSLLCQVGLPYTYLMFALTSGTPLNAMWKKYLGVICLIPVIYTIWITPLFPLLQIDYQRLTLWVIPYIVIASLLLIAELWKEKD